MENMRQTIKYRTGALITHLLNFPKPLLPLTGMTLSCHRSAQTYQLANDLFHVAMQDLRKSC